MSKLLELAAASIEDRSEEFSGIGERGLPQQVRGEAGLREGLARMVHPQLGYMGAMPGEGVTFDANWIHGEMRFRVTRDFRYIRLK